MPVTRPAAPGLARSRRRSPGSARDAGFSLVELAVAMSVLAVVMAVFVSTVTLMVSQTRKAAATADLATRGRAALDVLSRQLSYASAVNTPVSSGGSTYLEFRSDVVLGGTDPQCTQWRWRQSAGALDYRTWNVVTAVATGWIPVTGSVANDPATQPPFTVLPQDQGFDILRVGIDLRLRSTTSSVSASQGQYTLRNSQDAPAPTASTVCTEKGRP